MTLHLTVMLNVMRFLGGTATMLAVVFLSGDVRAQTDVGWAALRVAHLSPDAPLVDVLINGELTLKDIGFGDVSGYITLPAGEHELKVFPHRLPMQPEAEPANGAQEGAATAQEDNGLLAPPDGVQALEPITILATLDGGRYHTAVLSGFYQPPPVRAQLGGLSINIEPADAQFDITGPRGYAENLTGDQLLSELEPGTYTITVRREGYKTMRSEVEVQANVTSTVAITLQREEGQEAAPQQPPAQERGQATLWQKVELQVYRDELAGFPAAGQVLVRVIHASPITPAVDVVVQADAASEGEPRVLAEGLSFPNLGEYRALPAATYTVRFHTAGTDHVLSEVPDFALEPGVVYTLYLVAATADSYLMMVPSVDAAVMRVTR